MLSLYNVEYDTLCGKQTYALTDMPLEVAESLLKVFVKHYINQRTGRGKLFPNRKGCYTVRNPRVVFVRNV